MTKHPTAQFVALRSYWKDAISTGSAGSRATCVNVLIAVYVNDPHGATVNEATEYVQDFAKHDPSVSSINAEECQLTLENLLQLNLVIREDSMPTKYRLSDAARTECSEVSWNSEE